VTEEDKFLRKWGSQHIDFKDYKDELLSIYESDDPYNYLLYKCNLPWFSFSLPGIDMKEIEKECWQVFNNPSTIKQDAKAEGHDDSYGWKLFFLYRSATTTKRDHGRYKDLHQVNDYSFVYENEYPALKELIMKYQHKGVPSWISANPPGGRIPLHSDTPPPAKKLCKTRLAVTYPDDCAMIMEDAGVINYYDQELVLFNQRKAHGVWNNSKKWKLDISITGHPDCQQTHNDINVSIKNKIERLLEE